MTLKHSVPNHRAGCFYAASLICADSHASISESFQRVQRSESLIGCGKPALVFVQSQGVVRLTAHRAARSRSVRKDMLASYWLRSDA